LKKTEGLFESYCEYVLSGQSGIVEAFRVFYEMEGRYPTFEELLPPGGPVLLIR
jgi:hypothetical protein